jgi:hypothetical protein
MWPRYGIYTSMWDWCSTIRVAAQDPKVVSNDLDGSPHRGVRQRWPIPLRRLRLPRPLLQWPSQLGHLQRAYQPQHQQPRNRHRQLRQWLKPKHQLVPRNVLLRLRPRQVKQVRLQPRPFPYYCIGFSVCRWNEAEWAITRLPVFWKAKHSVLLLRLERIHPVLCTAKGRLLFDLFILWCSCIAHFCRYFCLSFSI